jgi:hypothetical protein
MKTYHAVEIRELDKYAPRLFYRSDLYPTKEKAIEAFQNLNTMELFQAMAECQNNEDPPVSFAADYDDADALHTAYDKGVQEVSLMVDKFLTMSHRVDEDVDLDAGTYLTLHVANFAVHDEKL